MSNGDAKKTFEAITGSWEGRRRLRNRLERGNAESQAECEAWLETLPPDEAKEHLTAVMENRFETAPAYLIAGLLLMLVMPLLPILLVIAPILALIAVLVFVFGAGILAVISLFTLGAPALFPARKPKTPMSRAAMLLARRGDERALGLLVEDWLSDLPGFRRRDDATEETEAELALLLIAIAARADGGGTLTFAYRVYLALKRLVTGALNSSALRSLPDWSDRRTDMIIAALLILQRSPTATDRSLLRRVAALPGGGTNRALLRGFAAQLLNPNEAQTTAARVNAARQTSVASLTAPQTENTYVPSLAEEAGNASRQQEISRRR